MRARIAYCANKCCIPKHFWFWEAPNRISHHSVQKYDTESEHGRFEMTTTTTTSLNSTRTLFIDFFGTAPSSWKQQDLVATTTPARQTIRALFRFMIYLSIVILNMVKSKVASKSITVNRQLCFRETLPGLQWPRDMEVCRCRPVTGPSKSRHVYLQLIQNLARNLALCSWSHFLAVPKRATRVAGIASDLVRQ